MEINAKLNHLRIAPRKVRLVGGVICGKRVGEALTILHHLPKRASHPMEKLLKSAVANAKHNFNIPEKNLYIKKLVVDSGSVLKRTMPRAFGRAALIKKRSSHITLVLDEMSPSHVESRRPKKAKGPELRTVSPEELKALQQEDPEKTREHNAGAESTVKREGRGFTGRIFNRKAV